VDGNNLIGIFAGDKWGTSEDKIIPVLAHWDTVTYSPGYDDNGSGVAALLEIAQALGEAQCKPEFTIILVAVELEEMGTQGAISLVHDFLIERILKPFTFPEVQVYMKVRSREKNCIRYIPPNFLIKKKSFVKVLVCNRT
jgi:hypothetical protein